MMGFHLAQSLSFCSRLLLPPPDFLGAMEREGKRGGTWKLARKTKLEEKETMVGESDKQSWLGINNPDAARCLAVPLRAVNARSNRAPRRYPRRDASLPTLVAVPTSYGEWVCAANRHVRSRACRARASTVPEPHDGAPKGALTICLSPTRGSFEQKVGLSPRVRLGAARRPSPRLGLPFCARGLLS